MIRKINKKVPVNRKYSGSYSSYLNILLIQVWSNSLAYYKLSSKENIARNLMN